VIFPSDKTKSRIRYVIERIALIHESKYNTNGKKTPFEGITRYEMKMLDSLDEAQLLVLLSMMSPVDKNSATGDNSKAGTYV